MAISLRDKLARVLDGAGSRKEHGNGSEFFNPGRAWVRVEMVKLFENKKGVDKLAIEFKTIRELEKPELGEGNPVGREFSEMWDATKGDLYFIPQFKAFLRIALRLSDEALSSDDELLEAAVALCDPEKQLATGIVIEMKGRAHVTEKNKKTITKTSYVQEISPVDVLQWLNAGSDEAVKCRQKCYNAVTGIGSMQSLEGFAKHRAAEDAKAAAG